MEERIYHVNFHVKKKRKVHNLWFTDREKAEAFLESIKNDSSILDYTLFSYRANELEAWTEDYEEESFKMHRTNRPELYEWLEW